MKNAVKILPHPMAASLAFLITFLYCQPAPVTGRRQLTLVSQSELLQMSFRSYDEFLDENQVVRGTQQAAMVRQVGEKIAAATEDYLRDNNMGDRVEGYKWEFSLIADTSINAFAMPGGKIGVFTGILDVTETRAGLATVVAHEIAHAVAWHGNERMSQGLLVQLGGIVLQEALRSEPVMTQRLFMAAFGLGAQVGVLLPYSRLHESEADRLGMIFMAKAGYDPREAVDFWQRMDSHKKGEPPQFLSTHPSSETRIAELKKFLPEALEYYNQEQPRAKRRDR